MSFLHFHHFQFLTRSRQSSCNNQFLTRPRQSYIKYSKLFSKAVQNFFLLNHLFYQAGGFGSFLCTYSIQSHSQLHMKNNAASGILHVKPAPHSGHKYNRKLQSFAFVNSHNPCCIRLLILYTGFSIIHIVFLQLLYIPYKMKQSFITGSLEASGLFYQHFQVGRPLFSSRHCRRIISISSHIQNLPQQFMHRRIGNHSPECFNLFPDPVYFLTYPPFMIPVLQRRFPEKVLFAGASDSCQLLLFQPSDGRRKNRRQRDILSRVIQHPQIIQHHSNLTRRKIPFPGPGVRRNSFSVQFLCKNVRRSLNAPCKNHDIRIPDLTQFLRFLVCNLCTGHKFTDPPGNRPRFQLSVLALCSFTLTIHQQYFSFGILCQRKFSAGIKLRLFIISNASQICSH